MASTFTARLNLEKIADGEQDNTWGASERANQDLLDAWLAGYVSKSVAGASNVTLTQTEYANHFVELTGTLTGNIDVIFPAVEGRWVIKNSTSGAFTITIKVSGQTGATIDQGDICRFYNDGTDMRKITWGVSGGGTGVTSIAALRTALTSMFHAVLAKTAAYTLTTGDRGKLVDADASGGVFTVTLPAVASATDGYAYAIVKADSSSNAVTIDADGSETINGAASLTLSSQNDWAVVVSDGTEWWALQGGDPYVLPTITNSLVEAALQTGSQILPIDPSVFKLPTSGGAQDEDDIEIGNGVYRAFAFDGSSEETIYFNFPLPASFTGSTIKFAYRWSSTGSDTDGVAMELACVAGADNENLSSMAYGTGVAVVDNLQSAANRLLLSAESGNVTIAGTPVSGELCHCRLRRKVANASDTMAEDCRIVFVYLLVPTDAHNED